jgi:hypothetical protein
LRHDHPAIAEMIADAQKNSNGANPDAARQLH